MTDLPLVSIVTPCYNMRGYLRETIESVLSQDYPKIEYIVVDGGSTDGTTDLLKSYGDRFRWISGPDEGPADAINQGFKMCRGVIFAWLNADDTYRPGTVSKAVKLLRRRPNVDIVYGRGTWVDAGGEVLAPYPTQPFDAALLARECFICQPASFMRSQAFRDVGGLDASLACCFDYDLWIRLAQVRRFAFLNEDLATSRMHPCNKTLGGRDQVFKESIAVLKQHYGFVPFQLVYSQVCYQQDGRDQFFSPLRPSFASYLAALPAGLTLNRSRPMRYAREWLGAMSFGGLVRMLRRRLAPEESCGA